MCSHFGADIMHTGVIESKNQVGSTGSQTSKGTVCSLEHRRGPETLSRWVIQSIIVTVPFPNAFDLKRAHLHSITFPKKKSISQTNISDSCLGLWGSRRRTYGSKWSSRTRRWRRIQPPKQSWPFSSDVKKWIFPTDQPRGSTGFGDNTSRRYGLIIRGWPKRYLNSKYVS